MQCTRPIYALDLGINPETGKRNLKIKGKSYDFLCHRYGIDNIVPLPCGKCFACKVNYAQAWADRCYLESLLYKDNYFITLTFDNENVPLRVCKKDISSFMKSLRNHIPGCRFFSCGEHGGLSGRSHYHILLFNAPIPDLKYFMRKNDSLLYTSKLLSDIWKKGFVTIGDVTRESCNYVARYVIKKFGTHFNDEFVLMSNRPGIGAKYFFDNKDKIIKNDAIYINGKPHLLPRYFDKLLESSDPAAFVEIKKNRLTESRANRVHLLNVHGFTYDEQLLMYQDSINNEKLTHLNRGGI